MISLAIVACLLLKVFVVKNLTLWEKHHKPTAIKQTASKENKENSPVVDAEHDGEDNHAQERKENVKGLLSQELIDTPMITHALHEVAHLFALKE